MSTYQSICRVQFNLQQELQQKILGASFWKRCSRRRVEISQGKYITVEALMEKVIKPFVTCSLPSLLHCTVARTHSTSPRRNWSCSCWSHKGLK